MTLNWEGGFQYGGACTADGLAAATNAAEYVYGGVMVAGGEAAVEDYMSVEDGANGVGDGVIHVIAFD